MLSLCISFRSWTGEEGFCHHGFFCGIFALDIEFDVLWFSQLGWDNVRRLITVGRLVFLASVNYMSGLRAAEERSCPTHLDFVKERVKSLLNTLLAPNIMHCPGPRFLQYLKDSLHA